jgi:hypothetical protein
MASSGGCGPRWLPPVAIAIAAFAVIAIYLAGFGSQPVRNLGTDSFGYVAQIRASRIGVLDLQEERPGVAVTGALLDGIGVAAPLATPILLSISLAICLGLAAGAVTQTAFRMPAGAAAPIAVAVAAWGGTSRLAAGYLANLLSLALFLPAVGMIVLRGRRAVAVATILLAGALLGHPGLLPAYAAIVAAWALVSVPSFHREAVPFLRSEPASAAISLAAAAAVVVLIGVALGMGPGDIADFAGVRGRFDERAAEIITWISPWITVPFAVAGALALRAMSRPATASTARHLGIAWLGVAAAGLPLFLLFPRLPFHRTLLLAVPAPILIGVALASLPGWSRSGPRRPIGMASVAIALVTALGILMLVPFSAAASRDLPSAPPTAAGIATYLHTADIDRPVVIVIDPSTPRGVRDWKRRQNAVRALAPVSVIPEVVVYLGNEQHLRRGQPTLRLGSPYADLFDLVSRRTWPQVRELLDEGPVIVAARHWVRRSTWDRIVPDAAATSGDLAVLEGPVPAVGHVPIPGYPLTAGAAAARIVAILAFLAMAGGGWTRLVGASPALRAGLAPAFGLGAVVLPTFAVGALGADPGGPTGLAAAAAAAILGWILPLGSHTDGRDPSAFSAAPSALPSRAPARSDRPARPGAPPSTPRG